MNTESPPRLDPDILRAALPPHVRVGREIVIFEETDSTNDLARRAGDDGIAEGLVIFAETQRAGRGTQGRRWMSPPYRGLWFSVLLRPVTVPVERWPELTFCAALAVAEAAELSTGRAARIKWPNDVLVEGRKVAGILLECHHRSAPGFVVLGIGINVLQREEDFDPEIRGRAGSLAMMRGGVAPVERHRVAAAVLARLEHQYARWPEAFSGIRTGCERLGGVPPPEDTDKTKGGSLSGTAF